MALRWIAGLLAAAAVLTFPARALAHATLIRTTPANGAVLARSPHEARFVFDDPVRIAAGIRAVRNGGESVLGGLGEALHDFDDSFAEPVGPIETSPELRQFLAEVKGQAQFLLYLTDQIEESGQHEVLNWFCLLGAMEALGRKPAKAAFLENWAFVSPVVFANYHA